MSLLFIAHPKETDLALFAGGELGPLGRWRIERHLQHCNGCQDVVADFFHLQSEVGELAQLPALDWTALAQDISARVRLEAPAAEQKAGGWLAHPRIWQVGLATTALLCTIVAVRQLPMLSEGAKEALPPVVAETRSYEKAVTAEADEARADDLRQAVPAPGAAKELAAPQFAQQLDQRSSRDSLSQKTNEIAAGTTAAVVEPSESAAPASQNQQPQPRALASGTLRDRIVPNRQEQGYRAQAAEERSAPTDVEAEGPPIAEPLAVRAANSVATPAQAAPAPPPATPAPQAEQDAAAMQEQAAAVTPGRSPLGGAAFLRQDQTTERTKTERGEVAQASKAATPQQRLLAQAALEKKRGADGDWPAERGFTVLPAALEDPAVDVGVAADGWISIRAVDANTGTITITDVYVP
jgi:hypothetical protein